MQKTSYVLSDMFRFTKTRVLLSIVFGWLTLNSFSQELKFKFKGLPDTTVYLVRYYGPGLFYADTAQSKKGIVQFDGAKHHAGMYAVLLPNQHYAEFIYDNESVYLIVSDLTNLMGSVKVKQSENTKVYYRLVVYAQKQNQEIQKLNQIYSHYAIDSPQRDTLVKGVDSLRTLIQNFQYDLMREHPSLFVSDLMRLAVDMKLPDYPRNASGEVTDSNFIYNFFVAHYWDGVDLTDARLVYSPVFHQKLDRYFSTSGLIQHPDTIIKYADNLLEKMNQTDPSNKIFQYTLHHIATKYDTLRLMGMDKVVWFLTENYYCPPNNKAYWVDESTLKSLCEKKERIAGALIGNQAIPLILPDTTEKNWINFYDIQSEYLILYFWSPSCSHCKTDTPLLQKLYEAKFKPRGIEIFAIAQATGTDFELWKTFIQEHKLTFTNVGLTKNVYNQSMIDPTPLLPYTTLESLKYISTYDIYMTPSFFVLDKEKVILYKSIGISQLEVLMDEQTGHASDEKIIQH